MKLLILEFICGGCWPESVLPPSLHKEGWMMLQSLLEDAVKIPQLEIYTTWDTRLGEFPIDGLHVTKVTRPQDFKSVYTQLLDTVDQVLVIAPEFDNHLYQLIAHATIHKCSSFNSTLNAVKITSNKLLTKKLLRDHSIPTIDDLSIIEIPCVMKPIDGVGSTDNWYLKSDDDYKIFKNESQKISMMCEPFIQGQHYSMGVIVNQFGHVDYLPLAAQHIEIGRKITYQGGHLPVENIDSRSFQQLAERCLKVIPGLSGYFGIDMILPDDNPQQPIIVEINPRLTTSYTGYRQLTTSNLLERTLSHDSAPAAIVWEQKKITWTT